MGTRIYSTIISYYNTIIAFKTINKGNGYAVTYYCLAVIRLRILPLLTGFFYSLPKQQTAQNNSLLHGCILFYTSGNYFAARRTVALSV